MSCPESDEKVTKTHTTRRAEAKYSEAEATESPYKKPIVKGNMLTCPNCLQKNISPEATACYKCNTKFRASAWTCAQCKRTNLYATTHCVACNAPYGHNTKSSDAPCESGYATSNLGKKWFHYLIYFSLYASGVINIISGLSEFSSSFLFAIISIGMGIGYFFIRHWLASFKAEAPDIYLYVKGMSISISAMKMIFDLIDLSQLMDELSHRSSQYEIVELTFNSTVAVLVVFATVSAITLALERVYFKKRADWFNQT